MDYKHFSKMLFDRKNNIHDMYLCSDEYSVCTLVHESAKATHRVTVLQFMKHDVEDIKLFNTFYGYGVTWV